MMPGCLVKLSAPLMFVAHRVIKILICGLACLSLHAMAAEPEAIGQIKRLSGSVSLERNGMSLPVQVGTELRAGDRLRTGADGFAGITLKDDMLLTAGHNSQLLINDFRFNATTQEGGMLATLVRGTLLVVTGLIAKTTPQQLQFRTPTLVLGVRGTEFIVDAGGDEGAAP